MKLVLAVWESPKDIFHGIGRTKVEASAALKRAIRGVGNPRGWVPDVAEFRFMDLEPGAGYVNSDRLPGT